MLWKVKTIKLIWFQVVISQTTKAHPVHSLHISLVSTEYFHVLNEKADVAYHKAGPGAQSIPGVERCQVWVWHLARRVLAVNLQTASADSQDATGNTEVSRAQRLWHSTSPPFGSGSSCDVWGWNGHPFIPAKSCTQPATDVSIWCSKCVGVWHRMVSDTPRWCACHCVYIVVHVFGSLAGSWRLTLGVEPVVSHAEAENAKSATWRPESPTAPEQSIWPCLLPQTEWLLGCPGPPLFQASAHSRGTGGQTGK